MEERRRYIEQLENIRLERMEADIQAFRKEAHEDRESIKKSLQNITKILAGNGKIGIVAQVQILSAIAIFFIARMGWLVWEIITQNL